MNKLRHDYDPTSAMRRAAARALLREAASAAESIAYEQRVQAEVALAKGRIAGKLWLHREGMSALFLTSGDASRVSVRQVVCGPNADYEARSYKREVRVFLSSGDPSRANEGARLIIGVLEDVGAWLRTRPQYWRAARDQLWG